MILKKYEIMIKWTDNKIGAEGAIKIIESLMKNTTLTELYLGGDRKWRICVTEWRNRIRNE